MILTYVLKYIKSVFIINRRSLKTKIKRWILIYKIKKLARIMAPTRARYIEGIMTPKESYELTLHSLYIQHNINTK